MQSRRGFNTYYSLLYSSRSVRHWITKFEFGGQIIAWRSANKQVWNRATSSLGARRRHSSLAPWTFTYED